MGIDPRELTPHQWAMIDGDPADVPNVSNVPKPPKREKPVITSPLERDEQRIFANWLNSHGYLRCWHRTDRRTGADPGVFDFWVGAYGHSCWIEFKLDIAMRLRPAQEEFRQGLVAHNLEWHVVTTAEEAIGIVKGWKQSIQA